MVCSWIPWGNCHPLASGHHWHVRTALYHHWRSLESLDCHANKEVGSIKIVIDHRKAIGKEKQWQWFYQPTHADNAFPVPLFILQAIKAWKDKPWNEARVTNNNLQLTSASLSKESRITPNPFHLSTFPNTGPSVPGSSVSHIAWGSVCVCMKCMIMYTYIHVLILSWQQSRQGGIYHSICPIL